MFNRLKSKKFWISSLWVLASLVVLGLSAWGFREWRMPPEPVYRGKKLTEWQVEMERVYYGSGFLRRGRNNVVEMGRHCLQPMGTNALPFLLWQIQTKDSDFELWLRRQCEDRGWPVPFYQDQWQARHRAVISFGALEKHAHPAAPGLLRLAKRDRELRCNVVAALAWMEWGDDEFLQLLVEMIGHGDTKERDVALEGLLILEGKARSIAPDLKKIQAQEHQARKMDQTLEIVIRIVDR